MADRSLIEGDEPFQRREEAPEWGYEEAWVALRLAVLVSRSMGTATAPSSSFDMGCAVLIGGPLPRGHEFELHDVRFHWGRENQRGSEHTVNFKAFPMELHLMHWNSTLYSSIDEAVGKKHGIAIIALFVQIGKEHAGLKAVTEILQDIQYKGKSKTIPCFNPNSLLPDPLLRDYWVYEGSLTIPPCSEGVTWILFRYPLTVSQVQIEEFRRLRTHVKGAELLEGCDGILGDNFRPTQPLSDRIIRAAFQ
ncbi:carbonic anhydrase-related protein isoform X3 [Neopsephotus bourkii]|uniref:carbonic anhydrase-related protein isoform X3 n=1 Tax=Neopsephotus bourkii TaxID=309878 RepID=UPI002AA59E78|nr:carbonic anhydrase-related protein isoform X3 [Neopsephotus bourkii]